MERTEHRVAVVVDPDYAERVTELARERHVWVVKSPRNDEVVAALRAGAHYSLEEGVTTFEAGATPEESFLTVLGVVELHHGEYSHDPPLSVIEVIGLKLSDAVDRALDDYGFGDIEASALGFIARRDPS